MWHALERAGHNIGRDQVARLMRTAGLKGVIRGRKPVTTRPVARIDARPDLVNRNFKALAPNRLWVADMTYVRTRSGFIQLLLPMSIAGKLWVGQLKPALQLKRCL